MSTIDLYPAIDIRSGRVVRLVQGDYDRETVYGDDPLEVARKFADEGARWIHIVDLDALAASLKAGHLAGAAVDVFPAEPNSNKEAFDTPLRGIPNVILTAHIGGSTAEAQQGIGTFVANRLVEHVNAGATAGSVNLPNIALPPTPRAHRFLHLHRNQPGVLAAINGILARRRINILGQSLRTTDEAGYVVTDVNRTYDDAVIDELRAVDGTIRFRVLY